MAFAWHEVQQYGIFFYLYFVILFWFILAQGAKRCHDLGNSGFYQFIPFYGLWMLFEKGKSGENEYGNNPKDPNRPGYEIKNSPSPYNMLNYPKLLIEISSAVLFNVLLMAILLEYIHTKQIWLYAYMSLTVIPCFLAMLIINHKGNRLPNDNRGLLKQRVTYACLLCIFIRLYTFGFKGTDLYLQAIYFELIIIALFLGLTYVPLYLYQFYSKNRLKKQYEV